MANEGLVARPGQKAWLVRRQILLWSSWRGERDKISLPAALQPALDCLTLDESRAGDRRPAAVGPTEVQQIEPQIEVRRAGTDDFGALLAMKSDPEDVKWSGFAGPPEPEAFRQWYTRALEDRDRLMYTGTVGDTICGYVHFHRIGSSVFGSNTGIAARFRGRGCGARLRRLANAALQIAFPGAENEAWLAEGNIAAQRMMASIGYRPTHIVRVRQFFHPPRTETMRRWAEEKLRTDQAGVR